MSRSVVICLVVAACTSTSPPPIVLPAQGPPSIAGTGVHSCSATIGCYSACAPTDTACFASCEAGATPDAFHASHVLLNCLVREHCYGETCAHQACPDELQLCGLWLATINGPL